MKGLYWIGARESDIADTGDFFEGSITLYGNNNNSNISYCGQQKKRINHNVFSQGQDDFIKTNQLQLLVQRNDICFMSYDPNQVFSYGPEIKSHTVCLNNEQLMLFLNSKINFRKWAQQYVPTFYFDLLIGSQCRYEFLQKRYNDFGSYIIQSNFSLGGHGTVIMDKNNYEPLHKEFIESETYLVSKYIENALSINLHVIIYEDDILVSPGSIQIMHREQNKLLYRGADFVAYQDVDVNARNEFKKNAVVLSKELQSLGFRGILGIDAIVVNGTAYFLEINNRFQASTALLNKALLGNNLPSMHELNYESFHKKSSDISLENLIVNYSNYVYINNDSSFHASYIREKYHADFKIINLNDDGLVNTHPFAQDAYLFKLTFNTNISSVTPDEKNIIHPNITEPALEWHQKVLKNNLLALKISLLNRGVSFSQEAIDFFEGQGGFHEAVHSAVDIYIKDIIINSPIDAKFTALSPFEIHYDAYNGLQLYYYKQFLSNIDVQNKNVLDSLITSSGAKVKDICFLATDRVRIQHSRQCFFPAQEKRCKFCEINNEACVFSIEDIKEAVDIYLKNKRHDFRHFLIGGRSGTPEQEASNIIDIVKHIKQKTDKPIYLMCLPPKDVSIIPNFHLAGVNEIAFNIEIFDRDIAKNIMPGKGYIPLEQYLVALSYATSLWGKNGAVRTCFVVGLEPYETLLKGIESVCKLGVTPILSVFRPIPETDLENFIPPSNEQLYELHEKAHKICSQYGLTLGPDCVDCRNNTLNI